MNNIPKKSQQSQNLTDIHIPDDPLQKMFKDIK